MAFFSSKDNAPPPKAQPPKAPPRVDTPVAAGTAFIGPDIVVEGTVTGTEFLLIEGSVKGEIRLEADLRIGVNATVEATVHARNVSVEGRLIGDASADDRLELIATAEVEGNLKAPKIIVAEGAKFRGNVDMGSTKPRIE
jgi:cytoskeletal protein CcmA (bactofilin family)